MIMCFLLVNFYLQFWNTVFPKIDLYIYNVPWELKESGVVLLFSFIIMRHEIHF